MIGGAIIWLPIAPDVTSCALLATKKDREWWERHFSQIYLQPFLNV